MKWVALAFLCAAACDTPAPKDKSQWPIAASELKPTPTDPGERIYQRTCIACHGADGNGGDAAKKTGASFVAADSPLSQPDEVLLASILNGKTGAIGTMPAHSPIITNDEAKAVLAYVRKTFGKKQ